MGALRARPEYGEIKIQVHLLGGGWLEYVSSDDYKKNNTNDGSTFAGLLGRKIDGIRITSSRGYVTYQVHVTQAKDRSARWLPEVDSRDANSKGTNSYAGNFGEEIDAIRMK